MYLTHCHHHQWPPSPALPTNHSMHHLFCRQKIYTANHRSVKNLVKVLWLLHYYYNHFTALWILSGTTMVSRTKRNTHPLTPILIINHPLSASSIYCDPWHPLSWIYMPDSLFAQPLSTCFFGLPLGFMCTRHKIHVGHFKNILPSWSLA